MTKVLTGWHVFGIISAGFAIVIAVNLTLAYNAVHSFPGLETPNSYVASQEFERKRNAQDALGWDVSAKMENESLILTINSASGAPVRPVSVSGTFGRATTVAQDQDLVFLPTPTGYTAAIAGGAGNWNLRMLAISDDGTVFQRRIVLHGGQG